MPDIIIYAEDPSKAVAFASFFAGGFKPPQRLHPDFSYGEFSGRIYIRQATEDSPGEGIYLSLSGEWDQDRIDRYRAVGADVEFEDGRENPIVIAPTGERFPTDPFEGDVPSRADTGYGYWWIEELRRIHEPLVRLMAEGNMRNGRVAGPSLVLGKPRYCYSMPRNSDGFRLIVDVDEDTDLGPLNELLATTTHPGTPQLKMSAMRSSDIPEERRPQLDRIAWWLDELALDRE